MCLATPWLSSTFYQQGPLTSAERHLHLNTLAQGINGDSTESTAVQVLTAVLNHPLGVRAADSPGVRFAPPRAVPVEVADGLIALAGVNEVKAARSPLGSVRPATGVELELLVRSDDLALVVARGDLVVFVTCCREKDIIVSPKIVFVASRNGLPSA